MTLFESPTLLRRSSQMPAAPPPGNPLQEGLERYQELRNNYMMVTDELHQTQANALELSIENNSLREYIDQIIRDKDAQIAALKARNGYLEGYTYGIRTRVTLVRQAMEAIENEALKYAAHGIPQQSTEEETADARAAIEMIERANANGEG